MKARLLPLSIFILCFFVASAEEKEIIKDKSPDGKFALLISGNELYPEAALIELGLNRKIVDLGGVGYYVHDTGLVWSANSQWVACFTPNHPAETTTVYVRNGQNFEQIKLPEIARCGEAKGKDGDKLELVSLTVTPQRWLESGALVVAVIGEWKAAAGNELECDERLTIAFDAQHKAAIAETEENPKQIGRKIESPKGTFFVEELDAPAKDDEGHPRMDQEVWIVSAKVSFPI